MSTNENIFLTGREIIYIDKSITDNNGALNNHINSVSIQHSAIQISTDHTGNNYLIGTNAQEQLDQTDAKLTDLELNKIDTCTNVGVGIGQVFKNKVDSTVNFKTIKGTNNITITNNIDDITIDTSIKNNFSAIIDPSITNDSLEGYLVGSIWINTTSNKAFICTNPINPANWKEITVQPDGGETNTASSAGGLSIYKTKVGVDLIFKGLSTGSNKIILSNNTNDIGIDVDSSNILINDLNGTLGVAKGGTGITSFSANSVLTTDATSNLTTSKNAPFGDFVGTIDVQTLSYKTIDADINIITNIDNNEIKNNAHIDASKIADGSVSNTNYQYINTVSSNVQDQLDGKATAIHLHSASDIISGILPVVRGGTGITSFLANSVLTTDNTSNLITTKPVPNGDFVGTTDIQTLTDKTIIDTNSNIIAKGLHANGSTIDVSASIAPTIGQILIATSSNTATWQNAPSSGEYNTASNVITSGEGLFKQKNGVDLEFKRIDANSSKISISATINNVNIDVNEGNLNLNNMNGILDVSKGGTGITSFLANSVLTTDNTSNLITTKLVPNSDFVGTTDIQTLTNKTIDASLNTISNIDNNNIKTNAQIDATKIANGTVDNIEFQYLNGVSSAIQTQLDGKASTIHTHSATDITSGVLDVLRGGTGQSTYTDGQLLIGNTIGNTLVKANLIGTVNQINVTNGSGSITLSLPQNIDITADPSFNTITSNVLTGTAPLTIASSTIVTNLNADLLDGQHAPIGSIVGTTDIQTLTNKTISGTNNTISDIVVSQGGTGTNIFTNNAVLLGNGINPITATKLAPIGDFIGTTDTQTLTNKTIDASLNTISNIDNNSIKTNAQIDAIKIADGTVDNIEFQYLNGVSSAIQTQLDGKAPIIHTHSAADITSGILTVPRGGTGQSTYTDGQLLIGNTATNSLAKATLTGTTNQIDVINGNGTITLSTPQNIDITANPSFNTITSNVLTGTAPLNVTSSTVVTNLNADLLDGQHGPTSAIVGISDIQTLTNKTIDASLNTMSNIDNNNIKTNAQIDATKIADGTVDNIEFQYLNGVSSSIQTQLDGKASVVHTHSAADITSGVLDVSKGGTGQSTYTNGQLLIGNTLTGSLSKSTLIGAPNRVLVINGNGSIIISAPQNIHTAADPTFNTLTTTEAIGAPLTVASTTLVSNLNADLLDGQHGPTSAIVGISDTQTLTNKTLTDTTNSIAAKSLHSATTVIDVSASTAPTIGQVLTATSGTTATWQTVAGSGEVNTASNVGIGGVGVFKQKTGVNLEFKNINAGTNKISVVNDIANNEIDIDVNEGNLTLNNVGGTLSATKGGTGQTVFVVGDLLQASATNTLSTLLAVATGNVLLSGGIGTISSWGKVGLTTHVNGILPIANGGTNASDITTARTNLSVYSVAQVDALLSAVSAKNTLSECSIQILNGDGSAYPASTTDILTIVSNGSLYVELNAGVTVWERAIFLPPPLKKLIVRDLVPEELFFAIQLTGPGWTYVNSLNYILMGFTTQATLETAQNWMTTSNISGFAGVWATGATAKEKLIRGRFNNATVEWTYGTTNLGTRIDGTGNADGVQNDVLLCYLDRAMTFTLELRRAPSYNVVLKKGTIIHPDGTAGRNNFNNSPVIPVFSVQAQHTTWNVTVLSKRATDALGIFTANGVNIFN